MYIDQLHLKSFRNYDQCSIQLKPFINIFIGKNGQGKTNLLEAIYFMSTTKSHRNIDDYQLIKMNEEFSCIDCHICYEDQSIWYSSVIHKKGKTLCIRNQPVKRVSEFIGRINAVLFSPTDMNLFDASPRYRRHFMDVELGKMSNLYINQLNQYNHLLKDRNVYLKQEKIDSVLLDSITEQMLLPQIFIIKKRYSFIQKINSYISKFYQLINESDDEISILYESVVNFNIDDEMMKEDLAKKYEMYKERDFGLHQTNMGIHREDIHFMIRGNDVLAMASQGQKRMIIIALKLSLVAIIYEYTGEYPILLLDDVLSELDTHKRNRLLQILPKKVQTIITTTDYDDLKDINQAMIYKIEKGSAEIWTRSKSTI